MCRLAAFPPNYPREKALQVLWPLNKENPDGFGYTYVNDEKFIVKKWPYSYAVSSRYNQLLTHMPYNGWTIAHLRWASHGKNSIENTHPFVYGNYATIHNGVWNEYYLIKRALKGFFKFKGQTDSEVAAFLIDKISPGRFFDETNYGIFLSLERNGNLHVMKCGGDLQALTLKDTTLIASELNKTKAFDVQQGYYLFDKNGKLNNSRVIEPTINIVEQLYANSYNTF